MTDGTTTERALRVALKEAADQIDVHPLLALEPADRPGESPRRPRRAMVLAAVAVLVTSALIGVFVVRDDDGASVRPAMPATRQVPSDEIPLASADLVVYMAVDATDMQIAVVRDLLDGRQHGLRAVERFGRVLGEVAHPRERRALVAALAGMGGVACSCRRAVQ